MTRLVLASTSRFRRALLERLGLSHDAEAPGVDETAPAGLSPRACAELFARQKAQAVLARRPGCLVIGADQTLELGGALLRKPLSADEAVEQLLSLSRKTHLLHSAVALAGPGEGDLREGVVSVELTMRALDERQARRYVERDRPEGSVGGYLFEKTGVALFDEVRGSDDSAIVGLPLFMVARLLREAGVDVLGGDGAV